MQIELFVSDTDVLNDQFLFTKLMASVPEQRREVVNNFKFQSSKNTSLAAGCLLNNALKERNLEGTFLKGPYGKPYLEKSKDFVFNLSHSGHYAICAVSNNEIGCDIEEIQQAKMNVAKRFFSEPEYSYLSNLKERDALDYQFTRLWTLKESFTKAIGTGLSKELNEFTISFDKTDKPLLTGFHFYESDIIPSYHISICSNEIIEDVRIRIVDLRLLDV